MTHLLRPMHADDAGQVLAIYQAGLDTGHASFETQAPSWEDFDAGRLPDHRHVATGPDGRVLGWTAVSPTSARAVYSGVVEHSLYIHPDARGRGIGTALLQALIDSTEGAGIWTIQSGVFPENTASLALHHKACFRTIGTRERIARHRGRWRDVVLLERRSPRIGRLYAGLSTPGILERMCGLPVPFRPVNLFHQPLRVGDHGTFFTMRRPRGCEGR